MIRRLIAGLLCALAVAPNAAAQDAATLDAARRLIEISNVEETVAPLVGLIVAQMRPALRQQAPQLTDSQLREFEAAFEDEMQDLVPQLIELNARSYAEAFTLDELNAIIAFYETPVGQKTIATLPSLLQKSMAAGAVLGQQAGVNAVRRAAERMRAKGYDL